MHDLSPLEAVPANIAFPLQAQDETDWSRWYQVI